MDCLSATAWALKNSGPNTLNGVKLFDSNDFLAVTCIPELNQFEGATLLPAASMECLTDGGYFATAMNATAGQIVITIIGQANELFTHPVTNQITVPVVP